MHFNINQHCLPRLASSYYIHMLFLFLLHRFTTLRVSLPTRFYRNPPPPVTITTSFNSCGSVSSCPVLPEPTTPCYNYNLVQPLRIRLFLPCFTRVHHPLLQLQPLSTLAGPSLPILFNQSPPSPVTFTASFNSCGSVSAYPVLPEPATPYYIHKLLPRCSSTPIKPL